MYVSIFCYKIILIHNSDYKGGIEIAFKSIFVMSAEFYHHAQNCQLPFAVLALVGKTQRNAQPHRLGTVPFCMGPKRHTRTFDRRTV